MPNCWALRTPPVTLIVLVPKGMEVDISDALRELVAQRLLGLAAGYEDLNDHNLLRLDPLFAVAAGKEDPLGMDRAPQDQGKAPPLLIPLSSIA